MFEETEEEEPMASMTSAPAGAESEYVDYATSSSDPVGSRLASSTSSESIQTSTQDKRNSGGGVRVVLNDAGRDSDAQVNAAPCPNQGFVPSPGFHQRRDDVETGNDDGGASTDKQLYEAA